MSSRPCSHPLRLPDLQWGCPPTSGVPLRTYRPLRSAVFRTQGLSEYNTSEPWAGIYVHNGGLIMTYRQIFEDTDCGHLQGRWDTAMHDVRTRERGSGMQLMGWGYATAVSWRGDDIGCPNFKGMNDGPLLFPSATSSRNPQKTRRPVSTQTPLPSAQHCSP